MTADARSTGAAGRRWDDAAAAYRTDWEGRYGGARRWDDYGPAYRYGWEAAADDRYRGRDYAAAEADLRRDFDAGYGRYRSGHEGHSVQAHATAGGKVEHTWDTFKDAVKEGWDRARTELTGGRRAAGATGPAGAARDQVVEAEGQVRVPVREERLEVEKRPTELGAVEVRKTVQSEQQTVPVELTREEVHVEQRDVAA